MSTDTLTRPDRTDAGHGELVAHYANKDQITYAHVTGEEIEALCGKRWIPCRDPEGLPVCGECKRIYAELP